jgi:phosphatidylglycerophosphatase A
MNTSLRASPFAAHAVHASCRRIHLRQAKIRLKRYDPGSVVLDVFAAMPNVYEGLVWPAAWLGTIAVLVAGLLLFRVFDILKPLDSTHP